MDRGTRTFDSEDLKNALDEVNKGKLSIRKAALAYKIPLTTLRRRKKLGTTMMNIPPGSKPALGDLEEDLVTAITELAHRNHGLTRLEIMKLAKNIDSQRPPEKRMFKNELPSSMWFSRFQKRNELRLRVAQNLSVARQEMSTEEVKKELFSSYRKLVSDFNFTADIIYNVDETGLQLVTKSLKISCRVGTKNVTVRKSGERSETISVAACVNASASVILPPFVIFRGKSLDDTIILGKYPEDTLFTFSKNGYMTSELFTVWLHMFVEKIPPKRPVLLLMDGHTTHITYDAVTFAKQNRIELFCFPPHTSHLYQPLDVGVFRSLKEEFRRSVHAVTRKTRDKLKRQQFGKVFTSAWDTALNRINILGGFRGSGMWPINENKVQLNTNATKSSTTSTSALLATPSTSILSLNSTASSISDLSSRTSSMNSATSSISDISAIVNSTSSLNLNLARSSTPTNLDPSSNALFSAIPSTFTSALNLNSPPSPTPTISNFSSISSGSGVPFTDSTSMVVTAIKELLQPSPEKPEPPGRKIRTSRYLTANEFMLAKLQPPISNPNY